MEHLGTCDDGLELGQFILRLIYYQDTTWSSNTASSLILVNIDTFVRIYYAIRDCIGRVAGVQTRFNVAWASEDL
jgi:hypothetical protein